MSPRVDMHIHTCISLGRWRQHIIRQHRHQTRERTCRALRMYYHAGDADPYSVAMASAAGKWSHAHDAVNNCSDVYFKETLAKVAIPAPLPAPHAAITVNVEPQQCRRQHHVTSINTKVVSRSQKSIGHATVLLSWEKFPAVVRLSCDATKSSQLNSTRLNWIRTELVGFQPVWSIPKNWLATIRYPALKSHQAIFWTFC